MELKVFLWIFVLIGIIGIVSATSVYYPLNVTNSICSIDSDCSLNENLSQLGYQSNNVFVSQNGPPILPNGSCVNFSWWYNHSLYSQGCPGGWNKSIVYTDIDDFFSLNITILQNYTFWYSNSSYWQGMVGIMDYGVENLSKLYSIEAKCLSGICGKQWTTLGGSVSNGTGMYGGSDYINGKYMPKLSEVKDLIFSGGSFKAVLKMYNPQIYPLIQNKWLEMWKKSNFNNFPSNMWDLTVLLIKYLGRQPASLVPNGGFDKV